MSIAENVQTVRQRIERAAQRAGRSPAEVTVVAVSKGFPAAAIVEALAAGIQHIGENRIPEAEAKVESLAAQGRRPIWHLVGHLQTNKVKAALMLFDVIQSVDSLHLAEALSRRARQPVPILLEVNVAGEASKYGFAADEVMAAAEAVARLPNLEVRGLMTVAPLVADPEEVRPVFRRLREMRDALGLRELSMGMTDDLEVAVEEGATIVRIGRAIFGQRPERPEVAGQRQTRSGVG